MKLEWFRSATVSLTSASGTSVLCDPWITDGAFIGSWHHWPPLEGFEFEELAARRWDYVYISHLHADHFDRRLVAEIARRQPNARAVIADFQHPWLRGAVERCGFAGDRLIVASDDQTLRLGDVAVTVRTADSCDPTVCGVSTPCSPEPDWQRAIDSIAVFEADGLRVLHANDALAVASIANVLDTIGNVDVLLGHYGGAGPFPQTFPDVEDKRQAARRIAESFMYRLATAADLLKARYVMPFAGQYQLGGRLASLNNDRSVVPLEEAVAWVDAHCQAKAISLQPFQPVDLHTGELGATWVEPSAQTLRDYITRIETHRYPYERNGERWPGAKTDLEEVFQRIASRVREGTGSHHQIEPVSIQIVADPELAIVDSHECDLPEISLTLDFFGDRLGGGVDTEPAFVDLTRISVDPRLLRRLIQRAPDYRGFTQMHWNQAEIGSHFEWRRAGIYNPIAHGFLNFVS
jgi:UDP-MurNAc hydroxylase